VHLIVELLVPMTWPLEQKSLDDEDEDNEDENPNVMQCYRKYKLDLLTSGIFETILTMIIKALRKPHRYKKGEYPFQCIQISILNFFLLF
jgi:hypothetical protein